MQSGDVVVFLGCALSLFGGGSDSNSYTPVSAEVEAYDPLSRQYAAQHGITEYVKLIKAVMMQESGGRGSDPMQAEAALPQLGNEGGQPYWSWYGFNSRVEWCADQCGYIESDLVPNETPATLPVPPCISSYCQSLRKKGPPRFVVISDNRGGRGILLPKIADANQK